MLMNPKLFRTIEFSIGLCLLLAGLFSFPVNTRASGGEIDIEAIEAYVTDQVRVDRIPGLALGIVKGDQIVYLKGYGRADPSGRPVTPQTPFLIGSVTKAFTALAVMQLVEAGKVELDAPVQRYLPWFRVADPQASAQITIRHLLNQTSGISQYATMATMTWFDQDDLALERHVRFLENVELNRQVGQSYEYSNANYGVLGLIVQAVSGLSYEEYIRQSIFTPLDMQNSFVSQDEAILNCVLPLLILYLALEVPAWKVTVLMVPDLGYWLEAVAAVVFLKGLLEIGLIWRVFKQSHQNQVLQPVPG